MRLGAGHSPLKYRFATGGLLVAKAMQTIALTCVDCAGSSSLNYRVGAGRKRAKILRVGWQVARWKFRRRALNVVGWKCAVGALSCYSVKAHHALMGHMV